MLTVIAGVGTIVALRLWPARDPDIVPHAHDDLPADHPHLREAHGDDGGHGFVIDDLHPTQPVRY